jgi:hypothetical protein
MQKQRAAGRARPACARRPPRGRAARKTGWYSPDRCFQFRQNLHHLGAGLIRERPLHNPCDVGNRVGVPNHDVSKPPRGNHVRLVFRTHKPSISARVGDDCHHVLSNGTQSGPRIGMQKGPPDGPRDRLVPVANRRAPRASRSALTSDGAARAGGACLPTGASRGGTQARFLKRQLSFPVSMISQ